jgi:hypothetical protein
VQNAKIKVQRSKCKDQSAKIKVQRSKCKDQNAKIKVQRESEIIKTHNCKKFEILNGNLNFEICNLKLKKAQKTIIQKPPR